MFFLFFADFSFSKNFKFESFFMLKILKLLLILAFLPSISFAWNSSCYSPVQMAAFMSKPKKSSRGVSQSSLSKLKAGVRKLEDALDMAEGDLQDSLDKDKLKAKTSSVASDIRDYIEDEQDGWDCAKGGQSFFFPSFLPQAYAHTDSPAHSHPHSNSAGNVLSEGAEALLSDYLDSDSEDNETGDDDSYVRNLQQISEGEDRTPLGTSDSPKQGAEGQSNRPIGRKTAPPELPPSSPVTPRLEAVSEKAPQPPFAPKKIAPPEIPSNPAIPRLEAVSEKAPQPSIAPKKIAPPEIPSNPAIPRLEAVSEKPPQQPVIPKKTAPPESLSERPTSRITPEESPQPSIAPKKTAPPELPLSNPAIPRSEPTPKSLPPRPLSPKEQCLKAKKYWNNTAKKCCPSDKRIVHKGQCVSLTDKKKALCEEKEGYWVWKNNLCLCLAPYRIDGAKCRKKTEDEKKKEGCEDKGKNWTWKNGKCVECPEWKKHSAFKSGGKVNSNFCDEYAEDKRACKRALSNLSRRAKQLNRMRDQLSALEDKLLSAQLNPEEESSTEASGVCFDCLKRVLKASQPSSGQVLGQTLGLLAGAGLSVAGYKIGKNAQTHANMMRIQQGYPSVYDGFSLTGMGAGYPFMANSLYGMTRANTPVGGWACSPSVSPHGHIYNYGYGYGHNMRYY